MMELTIEPHYLGSLEYFSLLIHQKKVYFEVQDIFKKQTYRNRAYFLSSNKIQLLNVPVHQSGRKLTKDVRIDYSQRWVKDHWGAFYSSYGKAPFFEYLSEDFSTLWERKPKFLIDLNMDFIRLIIKILRIDLDMTLTEDYDQNALGDMRDRISPKQPYIDRKIYTPIPYTQLFGDIFAPNLSVVDLIMCEGPNAVQILTHSFQGNE